MPNIALTNYCNLRCPYCFADPFIEEHKHFITEQELDKILAFISKTPGCRIGVIGGEPTIHPDFEKIIKHIQNFNSLYNHGNIVIFSNGINLFKLTPFLNETTHALVNLNEPEIVGKNNWQSIIYSLNTIKARGLLSCITLGINLYPDIKDYYFIFNIAQKFFRDEIRCSITAPTCQYATADKQNYYTENKQLFLNFVSAAKDANLKLHLDCNKLPICYFTEKEKLFLQSVITNFGQNGICQPVIDITPDFKATACFGSYDVIDLNNYNDLDEVNNVLKEKMTQLMDLNGDNKCLACPFFKESCQGGCLAFAKNLQELTI